MAGAATGQGRRLNQSADLRLVNPHVLPLLRFQLFLLFSFFPL